MAVSIAHGHHHNPDFIHRPCRLSHFQVRSGLQSTVQSINARSRELKGRSCPHPSLRAAYQVLQYGRSSSWMLTPVPLNK